MKARNSKSNPRWMVNIITDSVRGRPAVEHGPAIREAARRLGRNPNTASYWPQLARFPGDPEAFVESKSEMRQVLERRGWGAEGLVNLPVKSDGPPERYRVNPHIVERYVQEEVDREHGGKVSKKKRQELREKWQERLGGE